MRTPVYHAYVLRLLVPIPILCVKLVALTVISSQAFSETASPPLRVSAEEAGVLHFTVSLVLLLVVANMAAVVARIASP